MLDRLLIGLYLNLARVLTRKRPAQFSEVLRRPGDILLHLPSGAGEAWFALPALHSLKKHYRNCRVSLLLPENREILLEESLGQLIPYGKLTPMGRGYREMKNRLRGGDFSMFLNLNRGDLIPSVLSLLSRAEVRVGYKKKGSYPFFNCQLPSEEGDEIERSLNFLERIGVRALRDDPPVSLNAADRKEALSYLKSRGYGRIEEILVGIDLDRGDWRNDWTTESVQQMLTELEVGLRSRFLIARPPPEESEQVWRFLQKRPIVADNLTLRQLAGVISHLHLFITRKTDALPLAYGLKVPTILVLTESESGSFSPPRRGWLKVVEVEKEGGLPIEEILNLALETIGQ